MSEEPSSSHDLSLRREIDIPREKLWRCWTESELLKQWFCPKPWGVARAELDLRAGGRCDVTMLSPEGQEFPNQGIYLEVTPNERLVFTDAYSAGWVPSVKPFMTGVITFEDLGDGRTAYTAMARHWNEEDQKQHEAMGFHEGWGKATDQLEELAATL